MAKCQELDGAAAGMTTLGKRHFFNNGAFTVRPGSHRQM